ncbi:MAG TPA: AIM24 family protein [Acidimicrobiales bacterium]|nr:AIM24 family protein [Acidimicrobiales bacterium]
MQAEVRGTTLPVLDVTLDAGDAVISTHGELSWMTANVQMSQTVNTGGTKGFMAGLKRMAGGGGLFLTRYESTGGQGSVTFAAKMPGRIFPIEITPQGGFLVHRHGWLCGTPGINPTVGLQQTFRGGMWGGDGFILEKLEGQGTAWVELSGEIISYDLAAGQTLLVHPGHVGVFQDTVSFQITRVPGIANKLFGGDGYHLVVLTGPGTIWLQSMPLAVLARSLEPFLGRDVGVDTAAGAGLGGVLGGVIGRNI